MNSACKKNIGDIVDSALCCACGMCVNICPTKAISMTRNHANFLIACVEIEQCVKCGKCLKYCPSVSVNVEYLLKLQDGKWDNGKNVLNGYLGYSCDSIIRKKGQSGGVTSSLLLYLIDKGHISGALVHHFDKETQQPDVFLATNREEVISSAGSYYIQSASLKNIDQYGDDIAVVVTGCQCEALMLRYKQTGRRPSLIIGLICEGTYSLDYIHDLVDFEHTSLNITECMFRDKRTNGWPGEVYIASDNKIYRKTSSKRVELKPCYASYRCMQCYDMNNLFADIIVGDPWCFRKECDKEELKHGYTVVVARTSKGLAFLEEAKEARYINLQKEIPEKFLDWNSYVEGRVYKTKHVVDICVKENLPIIYGDDYKSVLYSNLCQSEKEKCNFSRILSEIKYSYALYQASSRKIVDNLIVKQKQKLAIEKIKKLPKNMLISCLVKIRNVFRYIQI